MVISLDVQSFDRHGFPWLQSTKHIYNIDNNIYKKSTYSPRCGILQKQFL